MKSVSDILTKKYLYKEYIVNKKDVKTISKEIGLSYGVIRKYIIKYKLTGIKVKGFNKVINICINKECDNIVSQKGRMCIECYKKSIKIQNEERKERRRVSINTYNNSEKRKKCQERYINSDNGKKTRDGYAKSEDGIKSRKKAQKKYNNTENGKKKNRKTYSKYMKTKKGKLADTRRHNKRRDYKNIELFINPFPDDVEVVYHHIDDWFVIPLPKQIHINTYCSSKEKHREKCNEIIKNLYGLNINYIMRSFYNKKDDD